MKNAWLAAFFAALLFAPAAGATGDEALGLENVTNALVHDPPIAKVALDENAYNPYDERSDLTFFSGTGSDTAVTFNDGTSVTCSADGRDTVVFYPVTDYTLYLFDHYMQYVRKNERLPALPLGADVGAPAYLVPGTPSERPNVLHSSPCTNLGFAGTHFGAGTYLAILIMHRHIPVKATPAGTDPFSQYEAEHAVRTTDGFILFDVCRIDANARKHCRSNQMIVAAHFKQ